MQDAWDVRIAVGGGTANGQVKLLASADGRLRLSGTLKPRQVEIASALEAFNRRPAVAGRASGETVLAAEGSTAAELARSFSTRTPFTIAPATVLRFDLGKAIRSLGREHDGQTALDGITGTLETQNTPDGMVSYFRDLKASSGVLSASGNARLHNRHIEAEFAVDIVNGLVGVPLKVTGPTSHVTVTLPAGAVAGALVGTALLPGVGTVLGARVGAGLGRLFGRPPDAKVPLKNAPSKGRPAALHPRG